MTEKKNLFLQKQNYLTVEVFICHTRAFCYSERGEKRCRRKREEGKGKGEENSSHVFFSFRTSQGKVSATVYSVFCMLLLQHLHAGKILTAM